ncbi:MAG: hypothetical protein ACXVHR_07295, partial [Methanobacterium sp.]
MKRNYILAIHFLFLATVIIFSGTATAEEQNATTCPVQDDLIVGTPNATSATQNTLQDNQSDPNLQTDTGETQDTNQDLVKDNNIISNQDTVQDTSDTNIPSTQADTINNNANSLSQTNLTEVDPVYVSTTGSTDDQATIQGEVDDQTVNTVTIDTPPVIEP